MTDTTEVHLTWYPKMSYKEKLHNTDPQSYAIYLFSKYTPNPAPSSTTAITLVFCLMQSPVTLAEIPVSLKGYILHIAASNYF